MDWLDHSWSLGQKIASMLDIDDRVWIHEAVDLRAIHLHLALKRMGWVCCLRGKEGVGLCARSRYESDFS